MLPPVVEGAAPLVEGHYRVKTKRGYSFVDADGQPVKGGPFRMASQLVDGRALVMEDGRFRIFSTHGDAPDVTFSSAMSNDDVHPFSDGLASVAVGELGSFRYGFVNAKGKFVIEPQFLYAHPFVDGLAKVVEPQGIAYIDTRGERVWPR